MAVYIPKNRLGSGSPRAEMMKQRIESTPGFRALRNHMAQAKEAKREEMTGKYESNAEVQRWRTLTKEEQARDAIERMVPTTKAIQEGRTGKECSYEDARKEAEKIAYRSESDSKE